VVLKGEGVNWGAQLGGKSCMLNYCWPDLNIFRVGGGNIKYPSTDRHHFKVIQSV